MRYYLGVDQGGTKTYVAICAENGKIVGKGIGGASIFYLDDLDNASTAVIRRLADEILLDNGLGWDDIEAVCAGLTGADWPFEFPIHKGRLVEGLGIQDVTILNDCIVALRAGSTEPNRAVVCAGTGLNIALQSASGNEIIYGYYIPGNLSGGSALGRAAVDAAIAADAGVSGPTLLTCMLLNFTGYASVGKLYEDMTTRRFKLEVSLLVPGLLETALKGDAVAVSVIDDFAGGVSRYVEAGLTRLGLTDTETEIVYSGGVFKGAGRLISDRITETLSKCYPRLRFVNARNEPVCGALLTLLDRRYAGRIPADVLENFDQGCVSAGLLRD